MMESVLIAAVSAVQAYLLGSIDTGILVSKFLYHDDVRKYGSGAAGMTNMLRTFGKKAAALTAFGDVLKGVLAVCIGRWLFTLMPESTTLSPYLAVYLAAQKARAGRNSDMAGRAAHPHGGGFLQPDGVYPASFGRLGSDPLF